MLKFLPKLSVVFFFLKGGDMAAEKELRRSLHVSSHRETKVSLATPDTASSVTQLYNWRK